MKPIIIVILGAAALGGLLSHHPFHSQKLKAAIQPVGASEALKKSPSKILAGSALLAERMMLAYYW